MKMTVLSNEPVGVSPAICRDAVFALTLRRGALDLARQSSSTGSTGSTGSIHIARPAPELLRGRSPPLSVLEKIKLRLQQMRALPHSVAKIEVRFD